MVQRGRHQPALRDVRDTIPSLWLEHRNADAPHAGMRATPKRGVGAVLGSTLQQRLGDFLVWWLFGAAPYHGVLAGVLGASGDDAEDMVHLKRRRRHGAAVRRPRLGHVRAVFCRGRIPCWA
jgi:hypothetical protein